MKPNIDRRGRIIRAVSGTLCVLFGGGIWLACWPESTGYRIAVTLLALFFGLFQWFEACRSWCIVRACGIRTPI